MFAETHTRVQGGGKWGGEEGGGWGDGGGLGIGGGVTSSPHHLVNTCAAKSASTHQIRILWWVGRWAGCVLVSIANELDRERLRNLRGETETEFVRNSNVLVDFEVRT
jgi:hypothetical protein